MERNYKYKTNTQAKPCVINLNKNSYGCACDLCEMSTKKEFRIRVHSDKMGISSRNTPTEPYFIALHTLISNGVHIFNSVPGT